jgi:hypothetical protein
MLEQSDANTQVDTFIPKIYRFKKQGKKSMTW